MMDWSVHRNSETALSEKTNMNKILHELDSRNDRISKLREQFRKKIETHLLENWIGNR